MEFSSELIRGKIIRNYKNVILDIEIEERQIVPAFCFESENVKGFYDEGVDVYISKEPDSKRKVQYEVQLVNNLGGWVFVNPNYDEKLLIEAIKNGIVEGFENVSKISRVSKQDGLRYMKFKVLMIDGSEQYIDLYHIYRKEGGQVVFPSNLKLFERKALDEMQMLRQKGFGTIVILIVPRSDCLQVKFSWSYDQLAAAKIFDEAKNGLKFLCYGCKVSPDGISIDRKMEITH